MPSSRDSSLDDTLLLQDNCLNTNILKTSLNSFDESKLDQLKPEHMKSLVDLPPLQLNSREIGTKPIPPFNPMLAPKHSIRTETLERHPSKSSQLKMFTSGRCSAEPFEYFRGGATHMRPDQVQLATSLSKLDLRNIDPDMAARLLDQIESGADVEPILIQIKNALTKDSVNGRNREKMVTFEEDFSIQNSLDKTCV